MQSDRRSERRRRAANGAIALLGSALALTLAPSLSGLPARLTFAAMALLLGWLAYRQLVRPGGHPVLLYHSVSEDQEWLPWAGEIAIRPGALSEQLSFLRRCGFRIISNSEWINRRAGGDLSLRELAIHFDDGYLDNWVAAAPILKDQGVPATVFVSLDFVSPERGLRPALGSNDPAQVDTGLVQWAGYLNWDEIRALETTGLIDVQPHGVDHARVPISDRTVSTVTPTNWRALAWLQWRSMPENKADWWQHEAPPAVGYGTAVPDSAPALSANAWLGERFESDEEFATRVRSDLKRCIDVFRERLDKTPQVFCWPENGVNALARRVASELGFVATTGGTGENRIDEPHDVISRLHVGDRRLGFRNAWADRVYLYASIRCFQGFYYWYYLLLLMHGMRSIVRRLQVPTLHASSISPGNHARPRRGSPY